MIQKIADLPQQQQIMVLVILLAGLGAFWWYYISPMGAQIETLESSIQELMVEVERAEEIERRLPEFERNWLPCEREWRSCGESFLTRKRPPRLSAGSRRWQWSPIWISRALRPRHRTERLYERWPINIALQGNYNNLGLFFQTVAQFTRIINVDNISIRGLGGTDQQRSIAATCTATTFVLADEGS